jgi:hypothetical protein
MLWTILVVLYVRLEFTSLIQSTLAIFANVNLSSFTLSLSPDLWLLAERWHWLCPL